MQRPRQISIALAIILLALGVKAFSGLTCPGQPLLGLVLAASGTAILACRRDIGLSPASMVCLKPGRPASLFLAALVLAGTLVSVPILKLFAWRLHDVPLPDSFYYTVAHLLPETSRSGDALAFWTGRGLQVVRVTFEGLGLYEIWCLAVALMVFGALAGRRPNARSMLRMAVAIGSYALVRFLTVSALAIELDRPEIMWSPAYSVLSWLPLAGILRVDAIPPKACRSAPKSAPVSAPAWILALSYALAVGLVIAFIIGYEDPGCLKQGRVMMDEAHADWEWADEPFDTTAYGIRAEYNYYDLREYLGHFYTVSLNFEPITAALLDDVDVLIIKTPTEPFRDGEVDAIEDFVAGGGGLLLIGDHTNLFGMSTHLNKIAERFAMRFRCDDTFDIATTGFSHYRKPLAGGHPAAREVRDFGFLTSCTIEGGMNTRPVMLGCGLGSEEADYAHPNFFGNIIYDLCDRFGLFLQAAAMGFGEGRVMLFSDSTCFSNFAMFSPGRCELALGLIDYLNRRGRRYPLVMPLMLASLGVMGAVLSVRALRRGVVGRALQKLLLMLPVILAGLSLGLVVVPHVNATLYGDLPWRSIENVVLFDTGHTESSFFTYPGAPRGPGVMGFEALYICAQRIGAHPCTGRLEDLSTVRPTGAVIANPSGRFSGDEMASVDSFLREGGTLLLLDSVRNGCSTANQLLRPYGMSICAVPEVEPPMPGDGAWIPGDGAPMLRDDAPSAGSEAGFGSIEPRLVVQGGVGLSRDHAGRARIAFARVGKGLLMVATDSFCYSHHVLGSLLERSRPSPTVRDVYSEVYALLGNLISHSPDTTRVSEDLKF